jgi:hypothetical protein
MMPDKMEPTATRKQSDLFGGILLCAIPAAILIAMHVNGAHLPMPFSILFGLFFLYGMQRVVWSLFKLNIDNTASWVVEAVGAAGFAVLAFWIAWHWKEGWSDGIPFIPDSWNQYFARILFACGGLFAAAFSVRLLRKALNQSRNKPDGGVMHL